MKRSIRTLLALAVAGSTVAYADGGMLPDGATISFNSLWLHEPTSDGNNPDGNPELALPVALPQSLYNYFNYAHCVCSEPSASMLPDYKQQTFAYQLLLNNQVTPIHVPLQIWVGASCDDPIMRPMNCHEITSAGISDIASIQTSNGVKPEIPVVDLMTPEPMGSACEPRVLSSAEWAIADTDLDGTPDYFVSQAIDTDSLPPPLPPSFTAEGAENAIALSWAAPVGNVADIAYYQALCATDLNDAVTQTPVAPKYMTPRNLCGQPIDLTTALVRTDISARVAPVDPAAPDAGIDAAIDAGNNTVPMDAPVDSGSGDISLPQGLATLDPAFICGEVDDPTATSMRIGGLQNNVGYKVVLLVIDKYGNAAGTYFTSELTPRPVTDFWEDLHGRGSQVEGGFCLIAETYGESNPLTELLRRFRDDTLGGSRFGRWITDAYYATLGKLGAIVHGHWTLRILSGILLVPLVVIALLWHVLTLPGLLALIALLALRRRIVRARARARALVQSAAVATTLVLILLAPGRAHAQTPYWDQQTGDGADGDAPAAPAGPGEVKWHVGVKVGPYTPGIDAQAGVKNTMGQGPYQAMFGGYSIMPMIDADRFLWTGFGQLGVGLSLGYIGKTAHAWLDGSDPNDPNRGRSPGDSNSFRLIPLQVTAIYRLTYFDDEYGVPLVPYARAGLGYYVWWITAPDGDFAKVCSNGAMEPSCPQNTAAGASLGLVGALGLSIRAERIDASAAQSMRESGLEHAGFYGEVNLGSVDGFGSSKKLSVGDTTWFAGVEFEF